MFSAFSTGSTNARKPKIQSVLNIENTSILAQERTFYDFSFLDYYKYRNIDTQRPRNIHTYYKSKIVEEYFSSRFIHF